MQSALRSVLADTLTDEGELSARAPLPFINLFPCVPPNLPHADGSCATDLNSAAFMGFHLRAVPAAVHPDAVQCGAVRCGECHQKTQTHLRHLHRVTSEPIAWQVFYVVIEQS